MFYKRVQHVTWVNDALRIIHIREFPNNSQKLDLLIFQKLNFSKLTFVTLSFKLIAGTVSKFFFAN